jgi:hypothetical protein
MTWTAWAKDHTGFAHVVPNDDLRDHDIDGDGCWCRPKPSPEAPHILIHNSLDGREAIERGEGYVQ